MKQKKGLLPLAALVLVLAVFWGIYLGARPRTAAGFKTITVTVVHKDQESRVFTCHTDEQYLGPVLMAEGIAQGEEGPYGLMIHTVDGETADWNVDGGYWALFLGGEYATTGADMTPIADGDSFRLVYTIG